MGKTFTVTEPHMKWLGRLYFGYDDYTESR